MKSVLLHVPRRSNLAALLLRQTPAGGGEWKDYRVYINEAPHTCDYIVVFSGQGGIIRHAVDKKNTLFIAGEPPAIKKYNDSYLAQFGSVISSDAECRHPGLRQTQQGHPWFCGRRFLPSGEVVVAKTYDDYVRDTMPAKTKLISVVCSDKQSTHGHRKRYEFVQGLKKAFGDDLDLFGVGQRMIEDKADAIRPYKYHIAIENSSYPHYWTEKLADSYLEESLPFYDGSSNIDEYFPRDSYVRIDVNDLQGTIELIRQTIDRNQYEDSIKSIREAKRRVLEEYNLFNVIADHFDSCYADAGKESVRFTAYPHKWFEKGAVSRLFYLIREMCKR